jgi:hypothetical protein
LTAVRVLIVTFMNSLTLLTLFCVHLWNVHTNQVEEEILICTTLPIHNTGEDIFNPKLTCTLLRKILAGNNVLMFAQAVCNWWLGKYMLLLHTLKPLHLNILEASISFVIQLLLRTIPSTPKVIADKVVKSVNFIKLRPLNLTTFSIHCEKMGNSYIILLLPTKIKHNHEVQFWFMYSYCTQKFCYSVLTIPLDFIMSVWHCCGSRG